MRAALWTFLVLLALPVALAGAPLPTTWTATADLTGGCADALDATAVGPIRGEWRVTFRLLSAADCVDALDHEAWVTWDPRANTDHLLFYEADRAALVDLAAGDDGQRVVTILLWDEANGERALSGALAESVLL